MRDDDEVRSPDGWLLVAADHPTLGRLYWRYCDESDVNAADFYGITDNIRLASWIKAGWRDKDVWADDYSDMSSFVARRFIQELLNPDRYDTNYFELFNWDDESEDLELHGDLHDFQRRSGQSVEFFVHWLRATNWFDIPAPGCNTLP
ncbi:MULTISPECIES: hypothetical protein [Pseudomonas]|uniref:Uncharacterized protein n=1 Tax=Pseudomonas azotoformans TaxID=47878 RepID=A0A4Q0HCR0_PSEAZ|nr:MULTISPECIES: hypothetical protein [Pseudomonas]OKP66318.1 hypothetical protein BTR19_26695 [Pseudomonas fluorescens]EPL06818.1 hypothetical protein CF150_25744 [Pseudomonas sp. CF150]KTC29093.1 hypothetical protein AO239_09270 [Pseudomonas sp. ICMP 19500]OEC53668.1 hypothetical protein A7K61_25730 [Pseudomonas sp. AP42]RXE46437.1 hypothetical protein B4O85_27725 [Pseudomonas azotoformans]